MKSGLIAVIGRANAGKSTLVNVLVGEKVSIVSPKPQTTRNRILGVLNTENSQLVFADTPGLYKNSTRLTEKMIQTAEDAAKDVDFILYVHDGHAGVTDDDCELMKKYVCGKTPSAVAYTKIDIMPKENIASDVKFMFERGVTCDIFPVSARKGTNVKKLLAFLTSAMPEGERIIADDIVSDKSEKFMIAEIMREKILLKFDKEVPHGTGILVNVFTRRDDGVYEINLDIVCEKQNHKAILIGKGGRALKEASSFARADMEKFLGAKVFLTVFVRVEEDWRNKPALIKEMVNI